MGILLGILLFSWFISSLLYIPFIRMLYLLRMRRVKQETRDAFDKRTPIFDSLHQDKAGTPIGGGVLIIGLTSIVFPICLILMKYFWVPVTSVYPLFSEVKIILFTFITFGLLGLLDDLKKIFVSLGKGFFGLRLRHKLLLEIFLATIISMWLVMELKIDILYIPILGIFHLGWLFIPFAVLVIIGFANAYNITDGLDGLAAGLLIIALTAFWIVSASILDTPISLFIAILIGSLLAFMYFNIYPARIFLGDVGALSFGATLAVIALILGKAPVLFVIGGLFVIEVGSSFIQLLWKRIFGKKLFAVAPFHLWLQYKGWPEPKVVMRFWVIGIVFALFGLWLALLTRASV